MDIVIQPESFNAGEELNKFTRKVRGAGAVVSFSGVVREIPGRIDSLNIEHYPGMAEKAIRDARGSGNPLSFLFLDIDNFQHLSSEKGVDEADEIRETVSQAVEKYARQADIIGRYGGEEFCVVLPHTTAEDAYEIAEKLRGAVATSKNTTVSIGVAELTEDMKDLADLIVCADRAMFRAKQRGRNRVITAKIAKDPRQGGAGSE